MNEQKEFEQKVFEYLDDLRKSGKVNMFGAGKNIREEFFIGRIHARNILREWMQSKQT